MTMVAVFSDTQLPSMVDKDVLCPTNWYINSTPGGRYSHVGKEIHNYDLEKLINQVKFFAEVRFAHVIGQKWDYKDRRMRPQLYDETSQAIDVIYDLHIASIKRVNLQSQCKKHRLTHEGTAKLSNAKAKGRKCCPWFYCLGRCITGWHWCKGWQRKPTQLRKCPKITGEGIRGYHGDSSPRAKADIILQTVFPAKKNCIPCQSVLEEALNHLKGSDDVTACIGMHNYDQEGIKSCLNLISVKEHERLAQQQQNWLSSIRENVEQPRGTPPVNVMPVAVTMWLIHSEPNGSCQLTGMKYHMICEQPTII
eukprot:gene8731-9663_t